MILNQLEPRSKIPYHLSPGWLKMASNFDSLRDSTGPGGAAVPLGIAKGVLAAQGTGSRGRRSRESLIRP
jgi:hypothetical protein